jgi:hypothetical protein
VRESSLYEQGNNAIYEGRWDRAVTSFTRLADLKGTRADSALYWKSYAQNRLGQRADALSTIGELTKSYPNSRYLKEAKALEVECGDRPSGCAKARTGASSSPINRRRPRRSRRRRCRSKQFGHGGPTGHFVPRARSTRRGPAEVLTNIAKTAGWASDQRDSGRPEYRSCERHRRIVCLTGDFCRQL